MVKVSVIVPVYNTEKFLARCLDSIINQTLKEIEIICANDASPDGSLSIMREYEKKYPNVVVIDSKENLKLGGVRNLGIKVAKGEYLSFIDSDDYIEKEMLSEMYQCAKKNNIDIVGCDINVVDENCKSIKTIRANKYENVGVLTDEQHRRLIYEAGHITTKLVKRSLIVDNNIILPEKLYYDEYFFSTVVFAYAKSFDLIRKPFYNYYTNTASISRKKDFDGQNDKFIIMNNILDKFKEDNLFEKYKNELEYLYSMFCYMNAAKMCVIAYSTPNYKSLYELRKNIREQIPDYRKKRYFKSNVSRLNKFLILLNDISPKIYVFAYKIYQFIKK